MQQTIQPVDEASAPQLMPNITVDALEHLATRQYCGVSILDPERPETWDYWQRDAGTSDGLWQANLRMLARGIEIRRLFIVPGAAAHADFYKQHPTVVSKHVDTAREQAQQGVDVRVGSVDLFPCEDFCIIDGQLVKVSVDQAGSCIGIYLLDKPDEVRDYMQHFMALWQNASVA